MSIDKFFFATKAMILREGKVLVLREAGSYADGTNVGRWDLPGGRLTPGERWDEALRREVREETGLDIVPKQPVALCEWRPSPRGESWQIVAAVVRCEAPEGEIMLSGDHDAFAWIDPKDWRTHGVIETLAPAFEGMDVYA
jgi:8-oxo-dGTP diphosphatase